MTNQEIIGQLVAVGQKVVDGLIPLDLSSLKSSGHINRMPPEKWIAETSHLTNSDLISLLKGITYVERELKWGGGSVAGGIWLFYMLLNRDAGSEEVDEVSAWIIKNTRNPYNPFGTIVTLDAKNYSEYKKLSLERSILIQQEVEKDEKIAKEAKSQRRIRKEKRLYSAQRRSGSERDRLIQEFNKMTLRDQLIFISKDDINAPNYYPTKCADSAGIGVIESLPEEIRKTLVVKLKGKHRGPWGAFKKRLLSVHGPVGDRPPWDINS